LENLQPVEAEKNTSKGLVRGVCARLDQLGYVIGGFDACLTSAVPTGSGLSSSASFEMLVTVILDEFYNGGRIDKVTLAQTGQYAEVQYFGKPSGLMDQMASIMGGFVMIDFAEPENPNIHRVDFDFTTRDYTLVIVETGRGHAEMTEEYAAISREMQAVAQVFNKQVLRDVPEDVILENLVELRNHVSDRALLRAFHFYADNQRVVEQVAALEAGNFNRFLELVNESGRSSWMLLQNCYAAKKPQEQGIPLALSLSEYILKDRGGAWRVHGGGFAGTIQAFVPNTALDEYISRMEAVFSRGACHPLRIRTVGAGKVMA
jgi:galactokinase